MKDLITIILLFFFSFSFAQKKDLYLLYSDTAGTIITKTQTDTLGFEYYQIDFSKKNRPQCTLSVNESGYLIKNIRIDGRPGSSLQFLYVNENHSNDPVLVPKSAITNRLTMEELVFQSTIANFMEILPKFRAVYVIDPNDRSGDYYKAKKVTVKLLPGL